MKIDHLFQTATSKYPLESILQIQVFVAVGTASKSLLINSLLVFTQNVIAVSLLALTEEKVKHTLYDVLGNRSEIKRTCPPTFRTFKYIGK